MSACERSLALALALAAMVACDKTPEVAPAPAPPSAAEPAQPARTGLQVGTHTVFGLPVPEGAVPDEVGRTHAYYALEASFQEVTLFFEHQLPDFLAQDYPEGRKLVASDASDRSLYIFRESNSEVLITYFDETPDRPVYESSAAELAAELDRDNPERRVAGDGSQIISANRPRRRPPLNATATPERSREPRWEDGDDGPTLLRSDTPSRLSRGTTNPSGGPPPIDFVRGEYIPPGNPRAYY